jgi:hypothetical protein
MFCMRSAARCLPSAVRRCGPLIGALGLCACDGDQVYVLGRFPGSGGAAGAGAGGLSGGAFDGAPADGAATDASCAPPLPLREYVFTGTGAQLADQRGGAAAVIRGGAVLDGSGELTLDGQDDYVNLPNDILTGLSEVTVVAWLHHLGGAAYTRIFDFGIGRDGEDPAQGLATVGTAYLAATPFTGFVPPYLAALVTNAGAGGEVAAVTDVQLDDALHMVAVGVSPTRLELFHDGVLVARVPSAIALSTIENLNNWLGRSQYDQDPYLHARYAGLRIYDHALSECAVAALQAEGP